MNQFSKIAALVALAGMIVAPMTAQAQSRYDRRNQTKNEWRNLAIGAGAIGVFGLLKGDKNLMLGGLAGAAYSGWRYEQDRKAQSQLRGRYGRDDRYDRFGRGSVRRYR